MQIIPFKPGSEHKRFWISEYSKIQIPLPPIPEQRKIAEILETVDNAIEKTDAIIEKYRRIKKGLMADLLTGKVRVRSEGESGRFSFTLNQKWKESPLGTIPTDWGVVRLGEICDITSSKRIYYKDYQREGIPFYRSKEIIEKAEGKKVQSEIYITIEKYEYIKKHFGVPSNGDLLITAVGTLGIIYKISNKDEDFYFKDGNLIWLKNIRQNVLVDFIVTAFPVCFIKQKDNLIIGTSQTALTIIKLNKMLLFVPPLPEQQLIAQILSQVDEVIEKELNYKEKLERLKKGLMEDLLTGKVRVRSESEGEK
jgi:type I restriction enzyme S subunit